MNGCSHVQLSGVLNVLGCKVTIMLRAKEGFLTPFDNMLRDTLLEEMLHDSVGILTGLYG